MKFKIFSTTRYTTCIPEDVGGSGNPSIKTGHGIVAAMEGALAFHGDTLSDKRISVQGFGNVSQAMVRYLFEHHDRFKVQSVYATDINEAAVEAMQSMKSEFPGVDMDLTVEVVPFGDNSGTLHFQTRFSFCFCRNTFCGIMAT